MLNHLENLHSLPSNPHAVREIAQNGAGVRPEETGVGALPVDPNQIALKAIEFAKEHGHWSQEKIKEFGSDNWSALT